MNPCKSVKSVVVWVRLIIFREGCLRPLKEEYKEAPKNNSRFFNSPRRLRFNIKFDIDSL